MKVLDLFSGIGGFSLGLERAGMETVAFCEIEEFPRKVLAKHWPHIPIYMDVRELTSDMVGDIDVICGGFPCQDISVAGKGGGINGSRSGLWKEYHRLIGEVGPRWVIIENVAALRGKGLVTVLQDLWEIGYDAEWNCITASSIGAPHQRDRIWIVAYPTSSRSVGGLRNLFGQDAEAQRSEEQHQNKAAESINASEGTTVLAYPNSLGRGEGGEIKRISGDAGTEQDAMWVGRNGKTVAHSEGRHHRHVGQDIGETCGEVNAPNDTGCLGRRDDRHEDGKPLAHSNGQRESQPQGLEREQRGWIGNIGRGEAEPGLGRGFVRVSSWLDGSWEAGVPRVTTTKTDRTARLKALGNSIVPQMAEIIGKAIMEIHRH